MTIRPTSPLITITSGNLYGRDISGSIASAMDVDNPSGGYYLLTGPRTGWTVNPILNIGEIAAWNPCMAVPNEVIDKLHAAFYDIDMTPEQREAFQSLETYIF